MTCGPGRADGTLTRMPDTAANRAAFGSAGTSDDSGPYPQLRALLLTDASTRSTLGAVHGPSGGDKADGEQKLLDKAMDEFPHLFTRTGYGSWTATSPEPSGSAG